MATNKIPLTGKIPIPERGAGTGRSTLSETLLRMAVGDSFDLALMPPDTNKRVHTYAKHAGMKVRLGRGPNGEHRCWRIE